MGFKNLLITAICLGITACGAEKSHEDNSNNSVTYITQCEINFNQCLGSPNNEGEKFEITCQNEFNICIETTITTDDDTTTTTTTTETDVDLQDNNGVQL